MTTDVPGRTDHYQIIDIAGDQFWNDPEYFKYDKPVYIGSMDHFHMLFEVEDRDIHEKKGSVLLVDLQPQGCGINIKSLLKDCIIQPSNTNNISVTYEDY